jgi:hypothetical protein
MKIIIYTLTLLTLLSSCKVTEQYVFEGTETLVINDTITIPSHHFHYEDYKCDPYCIYIESFSYTYTDTLFIEKFKCRKIRVKK